MAERRDVIRNHNAIWRAYLDLAYEKHSSHITVKDILQKADISRGTFYAHYRSIDDLQKQIEDEILQMIERICEDPLKHIFTQPQRSIRNILLAFQKNRKLIEAATGYEEDSSFFNKYRHDLITDIQTLLIKTYDPEDAWVLSFSIASILSDHAEAVVLNKEQADIDSISKIVSRLIPRKRV